MLEDERKQGLSTTTKCWLTIEAMKTAFIGLCLMLACSVPIGADSWRNNRARVCFDRPEDSGAMNGQPSWIRIEDYEVAVSGGQAVCLYFLPGSYEVMVTSTIFLDPHSRNTKACKSNTVTVELTDNEDQAFSIEPATSKNGDWKCGWLVHPIGVSHNRSTKDHP